MRPVTLALALVVVAGCTRDPTQLVVWIDSDLPKTGPRAIDGLAIHVKGPDGDPFDGEYDLTRIQPAELPQSFGIRPRAGDAQRVVKVEIEGRHGGQTVVRARASTSFIEHRRLRLDMFLYAICWRETDPCPEDQTCNAEGECVDAAVDEGTLSEWHDPPDAAPPVEWPGNVVRQVITGASAIEAAAPWRNGVVFAGWYRGAAAVEDDVLPMGPGGLVLAYGPDRALAWKTPLAAGPDADVQLSAVATTDNGDVVVSGRYSGEPDFGTGPLMQSIGSGWLIARLDGETGDLEWAKGWACTGGAWGPRAVATMPGYLAVAGDFDGNLYFNVGNSGPFAPVTEGILVVAQEDGEYACAGRMLAPNGGSSATSVYAASGVWRVAGQFHASALPTDLTLPGQVWADEDSGAPAFVSEWIADRTCTAVRADSIPGDYALVLWPDSELVVGTDWSDTFDVVVTPLDDNLVAVQSWIADDAGSATLRAAAVRGDEVVLSGTLESSVELLGQTLEPIGGVDGYVATFDRRTREGGSWRMGSPGNDDAPVVLPGSVPGSFVVAFAVPEVVPRGEIETTLPAVDVSELIGPGVAVIWVRP